LPALPIGLKATVQPRYKRPNTKAYCQIKLNPTAIGLTAATPAVVFCGVVVLAMIVGVEVLTIAEDVLSIRDVTVAVAAKVCGAMAG